MYKWVGRDHVANRPVGITKVANIQEKRVDQKIGPHHGVEVPNILKNRENGLPSQGKDRILYHHRPVVMVRMMEEVIERNQKAAVKWMKLTD